uniref:Uncharacterized protein n=1 Tax=Arundo donax TaxID=35708 RepID=A0A0A8ZTF7_ARUDO
MGNAFFTRTMLKLSVPVRRDLSISLELVLQL